MPSLNEPIAPQPSIPSPPADVAVSRIEEAGHAAPNAQDPNAQNKAGGKTGRRTTRWVDELLGFFTLILGVILIHSLIAKPFYIPSESMMPVLLKGDRLIVTKYPYGWSYVSPSLPNPVAIVQSVVMRQPVDSWGLSLPFIKGRLMGRTPERGDIVILAHPVTSEDYIKRVIGLPGDTVMVRDGVVSINGVPVRRENLGLRAIPNDPNIRCPTVSPPGSNHDCLVPIVRETLPNGVSFDTIDLGFVPQVDHYGPVKIPDDHVFLMGDNRDQSADSRVGIDENGLGGPVAIENIGGRAEFITFSIDGTESLNPLSWWQALRSNRAGSSLRPNRDTPSS